MTRIRRISTAKEKISVQIRLIRVSRVPRYFQNRTLPDNKRTNFVLLKILNYILAFYLVLLAVIPCCAFDGCPDEKPLSHQTNEHNDEKDKCGNCSPFFNCTSCSSATADIQTSHIETSIAEAPRVYGNFIPSYISDIYYDFWQPPRLG